jgi:hypothetical protein
LSPGRNTFGLGRALASSRLSGWCQTTLTSAKPYLDSCQLLLGDGLRALGPEQAKGVVRIQSTANQGRAFCLAPQTDQDLAFDHVGMREARSVSDAHEKPSGFGETVARRHQITSAPDGISQPKKSLAPVRHRTVSPKDSDLLAEDLRRIRILPARNQHIRHLHRHERGFLNIPQLEEERVADLQCLGGFVVSALTEVRCRESSKASRLPEPIPRFLVGRQGHVESGFRPLGIPPFGTEHSHMEVHRCSDLRFAQGIRQLQCVLKAFLGGLNPSKFCLDSCDPLQRRHLAVLVPERDEDPSCLEKQRRRVLGFVSHHRVLPLRPESNGHASLITCLLGEIAAALEQAVRLLGAALVSGDLPHKKDAMGMACAIAKALAKSGCFLQRRRRNIVVAREHRGLAPTPQYPCEILCWRVFARHGRELAEEVACLGEARGLSRSQRAFVEVKTDGLDGIAWWCRSRRHRRDSCTTYSSCASGVQVTLCTKQGGGHEPGNASVSRPVLKKYTLP